ncbi:MAG TPA: class I SAM-dependent methyltransferase [Candidatus Acidoferrum sp.]|nr:class I SAM-dependent methyltransferase [Candidatus Acidoferrum sp.]
MSLIPKEIESHYQQTRESERLSQGFGELERFRTQAILARYLPPPPATIFDVGGAAGVYAFPLSNQGYRVHLVDPVELHLEQARSHASSSRVELASITLGDARHLDVGDGAADAVLLLGPLYHLVDHADRLRALREAHRILKPGGVLFAAAISRFASLIDGLSRGFFQDPEFRKITAGDLASGQHCNPGNRPEYFTTAHFHRPEQLAGEVLEAGFGDLKILAVEGPVWSTAHLLEAWHDEAQRQDLMDFLTLIEQESSLLGASAHLIAITYRQHEPGS